MNRWAGIAGVFSAAALVAAWSGLALAHLTSTPPSAQPLTLRTANTAALQQLGIHLSRAAVPPGCAGLPLRLPGCPVAQAEAEAKALDAVGGRASAQVVEVALARVDITPSPALNRPLHSIEWLVALDRPFAGGLMVACPLVRTPTGKATTYTCGLSRYLVFVNAVSAAVDLGLPRPLQPAISYQVSPPAGAAPPVQVRASPPSAPLQPVGGRAADEA